MIRIINAKQCQVLHRKTSHNVMLDVISEIKKSWVIPYMDDLILLETLSLDDAISFMPDYISNKKLTVLVLISADYSYYDGTYRRRKSASTIGKQVYEKLTTVLTNYLEVYENISLPR